MKQTRREFVRTLFVATQAAAIGSLLPYQLFAADARSGGLNFLVFGDWGRNGEKDQADVATQMGIAAQETDAKFVISVGDNFYEYGVKSVDDPQWQSSFEKVYTAPSLQVPWYVALGNHDHRGNCDAQIDYSKTSKRWNMPAHYFTHSEKIDADNSVDFFILDTTPMKSGDDLELTLRHRHWPDNAVQVAWLEAALKASTAPWKIVIAHHPVYSGGEHGDTPYIIKNILPLLEKYQVQAYFNGHDYDLQHLQAGKLNLFCAGAGSKPRKTGTNPHTKFAMGGSSGFVAASLQADKLEVRMIDDQGKLLYTTTVPRHA